MITLPAGFDPSLLFADFFSLTVPFLSLAFLIACGLLLINLFKKL